MPKQKGLVRMEAERLAMAYPCTPSRTLAKRLALEFKVTIEQARTHVRIARGTLGNERKKLAVVEWEKRLSGYSPACPPSESEDWEPFDLESKRVGVLSDTHVRYQDSKAVVAAVEYLKKWNPDCILLNGDIVDFYSVSRWQKDPRRRDLKEELRTCRELLAWIRLTFKSARIVYKKGNHEERWDHYIWNHAPELCDLPTAQLSHVLDLEKFGIEQVDDDNPVMAGKLPILHGHELPRGISSPVNPARGAFMKSLHTVMVGHSHQTSSHSASNIMRDSEIFCWSVGCLCQLSPRYARINQWNHGFATVQVSDDGSFDVRNLRISSGGEVRSS